MKAVRVIWLSGSITRAQRYHAAKALFESGLADWDAARRAADRVPGILVASESLTKIDEIVRKLQEVDLHPQVTEREEPGEVKPWVSPEPQGGLVSALPERLDLALRDTLAPGETVEVSLHYSGQALVVTNERVLILELGTVASSRAHWSGSRIKSVPFTQITSADLRGGWVGGQIRITAQSGIEGREGWMPAVDESVFVFQEERLKPLAKMAVEVIRTRVKKAQEPLRRDVPESSTRLS